MITYIETLNCGDIIFIEYKNSYFKYVSMEVVFIELYMMYSEYYIKVREKGISKHIKVNDINIIKIVKER